MPTVPTYDNLQATPSLTPDVAAQPPSGPNPQQIAGQQLHDMGGAAQRAGDTASRIALSMQDMVNQVKVNDAVNQARQSAQNLAYDPQNGYLNLKGDAALTRPNGQALPEEYGDKLQASMSDIAGTLGNEAQRRQFQMNAADLAAQFHGQVETHMLGEFRSHALSVQDSTINLASDDAKRNWSDPALIAPSLNAAKAAVYQKGQVSGWSASQIDAALLTTTSQVHSSVIDAALQNNNPNYALGYLDAHRGEMTANDILSVQGHVNQNVWARMSLQAVQSATATASTALAPTNFDRMKQITYATESNNNPNAVGPNVPGQGTAKGINQVMDATAANPGFGVRPAADNSPQERQRVGDDLLQAMLQKYGDPGKAWAAYNAGPGRLDQAMADAGKAGTPDAWLANMPAKTQAYVTNNMAQLGTPAGGVPPRPTEMEFVNHAMSQLPPGSPPQVVAMTRTQASAQFNIIDKSFRETGEHALSAAQQFLYQNPGSTVHDVPPAIMDTLMRYDPTGAGTTLNRFAQAINKPPPTNNVAYNDIVSNMPKYAAMSDAEWNMRQSLLSPDDFRSLSKARANEQQSATDDTPQGLNRASVGRVLTQRLEMLGLPSTPKNGDTARNQQLGATRHFVDQSILTAQQQAGVKFKDADIQQHIDNLFSKDVTFQKSTLFGLWHSDATVPLMSMKATDIPDADRAQVVQALSRAGKPAPSDADILNTYRFWQSGKQ